MQNINEKQLELANQLFLDYLKKDFNLLIIPIPMKPEFIHYY